MGRARNRGVLASELLTQLSGFATLLGLTPGAWTLVLAPMHPDWASSVAVGPGGLNLTPYARTICRRADLEIHYVQLMLTVEQTLVPLRLAAAAFVRNSWDDGTSPCISEMVLEAIPPAILKTHLILTNGQALFPFVDTPHIGNDGIILHGPNARQRAMVHHIVSQSGCVPFPGCVLNAGQARPPEPGEVLAAFPFLQLCALPAVPMHRENPTPTVPPWLSLQPVQASSAQQQRPSGSSGLPQARDLGVYAMQALTDRRIAEGQDAPYARLSREIETRARDVRSSAYIIQDILQRANSTRQHLSIQPAANACWELASEMDAILRALPRTKDATGRHTTPLGMP